MAGRKRSTALGLCDIRLLSKKTSVCVPCTGGALDLSSTLRWRVGVFAGSPGVKLHTCTRQSASVLTARSPLLGEEFPIRPVVPTRWVARTLNEILNMLLEGQTILLLRRANKT